MFKANLLYLALPVQIFVIFDGDPICPHFCGCLWTRLTGQFSYACLVLALEIVTAGGSQ